MSKPTPTQKLIQTGLIYMRREGVPAMVMKSIRYVNRDTNTRLTLFMIPNIGSPSYFAQTYHKLHERFDTVLCEDGKLPVPESKATAGQRLQAAFWPIVPGRSIVPDSALSKYDGVVERDLLESRITMDSWKKGDFDPPLDPRASRAVERLVSYAPGMNVAMPWHVHHAPYLTYALPAEGFVEEGRDDHVLVTLMQAVSLVVAFALMSSYMVWSTLRFLLGV